MGAFFWCLVLVHLTYKVVDQLLAVSDSSVLKMCYLICECCTLSRVSFLGERDNFYSQKITLDDTFLFLQICFYWKLFYYKDLFKLIAFSPHFLPFAYCFTISS